MSTQEIQTLLTRTGSGKHGPEVETYKKKAAHARGPSTTTATWQ